MHKASQSQDRLFSLVPRPWALWVLHCGLITRSASFPLYIQRYVGLSYRTEKAKLTK